MPSIPSLSDTMTSILNNLWSVNQLWSGMYKYVPALPGVPGMAGVMRFFPRQPGPREIRKYLYVGTPEVDGKTFFFDDTLPSLPLPDLHETLAAYLDSCKAHLTEDELNKLQKDLADFEAGVGAQLHATLKENAENSRNWVSSLKKFFKSISFSWNGQFFLTNES